MAHREAEEQASRLLGVERHTDRHFHGVRDVGKITRTSRRDTACGPQEKP